jgi:hypothetical protein
VLDVVKQPLKEQDGSVPHDGNNKNYLAQKLNAKLVQQFDNMNAVQIEAFVLTLFNQAADSDSFRDTLRDFMIQMKQMSSADAYYAQEKKVSPFL